MLGGVPCTPEPSSSCSSCYTIEIDLVQRACAWLHCRQLKLSLMVGSYLWSWKFSPVGFNVYLPVGRRQGSRWKELCCGFIWRRLEERQTFPSLMAVHILTHWCVSEEPQGAQSVSQTEGPHQRTSQGHRVWRNLKYWFIRKTSSEFEVLWAGIMI